MNNNYFFLAASGLNEDGKVADLVRYLVEENGERGDDADVLAGEERGADGQAVCEVVRKVGRQVQVARHLDLLFCDGHRGALALFLLLLVLVGCGSVILLLRRRRRVDSWLGTTVRVRV